jgi:hypothetical protein
LEPSFSPGVTELSDRAFNGVAKLLPYARDRRQEGTRRI